jgi:flagellar biosynthesis/type III secretory pathway protein FliH
VTDSPDNAIRPFLPIAPTPTRPLGAALPALVTPAVVSPWTPRIAAEAPAAPSAAELTAAFDDAHARGLAEGVAETAALRARLTDLLAQLAAARDAIVAPTAEVIAEVASCVVEAWIAGTEQRAVFAPLVRGWLARSPDQPATARVHPDDAAALAEAIGDAPLTIAADPAIAPGALEIRGTALELTHDWRAQLAELRTAIVAALTGAES